MTNKVWIKVVNVGGPKENWVQVPLRRVKNIDGLKPVIKEHLAPSLDDYSVHQLTVKAALNGTDATNAVVFRAAADLESVLDHFRVRNTHRTVRQSFSRNIILFVTPHLNKSDVLKLCPPPLGYINKWVDQLIKSTGSTNPYARTPQSVVTWEGFKDDVNGAIWDDTPKYVRPVFDEFQDIGHERDVQLAFNMNVLHPLNILLESDEAVEAFAHSNDLDMTVGEPDFIQFWNQELRLAIEVKPKWALSESDLVAATYAQNHTERHAKIPSPMSLRRIFGYLSHNNLQFGALTTYDNTWFLYRPRENPGQLCVSPPIQYNNQEPTLLQCLFYLISRARDDHKCGSAPPSPPLPPPSRSSNGEEEHTPLEFFDWGSFRILDVLGTGRSGTVLEAILHGEKVALKICDLWTYPDCEKELLNEVKVYHALKDLQGYCIPRLKGAGYTAGVTIYESTIELGT